jgi:single-stranded-DNA-specific exonuclease
VIKNKDCWQLKSSQNDHVDQLVQATGLSKVMARVLVNRGITTQEDSKKFFETNITQIHNPFLLKDMDKAVVRITQALTKKESICIYGDYDVDGAVATSILLLFLKHVEAEVSFYIPDRLTEGYALNADAVKELANKGVNLIITVDNGINSNEAVAYAEQLGVDVVITDHHQVGEFLPQANAVVNPQRKDCSYPFKGLCGAGVVFKVVMALRQHLREQEFFKTKQEPNVKQYLDLLCLATVCDVVPLIDENRYFVKEGLKQLSNTQRAGIKALIRVCSIRNEQLTTTDVGYRLGPRINACGRLKNADMGVYMLTTQDDVEATKQATLLDYLNRERQGIETKILDDVFSRIESEIDLDRKLGIVMYSPEWHVGVVGIVASRVVEKYGRPVFVLTRDENGFVKGSGRSIPMVNLIKALNDCSELLIKYGGHAAAAGVTLEESNVDSFIQAFDVAVKKQMDLKDTKPVIMVDDNLTHEDIDWKLARELATLEPHGVGNAKPVFVLDNLSIKSKKLVGKDHLKLSVKKGEQQLDAIAFGKGAVIKDLTDQVSLICGLEINRFRDRESIQLLVKEIVSSR